VGWFGTVKLVYFLRGARAWLLLAQGLEVLRVASQLDGLADFMSEAEVFAWGSLPLAFSFAGIAC
jgi:hypothetical protein